MKWSFTASFLQLINAWQWFLSGVSLGRQTCLPAQALQMYYYSIFFSYGSFLSAQFKGHYTLKVEVNDDIKRTRKEVWVNEENDEACICTKNSGRGGEHATRAKWFYEVFRKWDLRNDYSDVLGFKDDRKFHTSLRNIFTYSLADMTGELGYVAPGPTWPSNEELLGLWEREKDCVDYYPEEFWALEHMKVAMDLHTKLLENYDKESPYTTAQTLLVRGLYRQYQETDMDILLEDAMRPILAHIGIVEG